MIIDLDRVAAQTLIEGTDIHSSQWEHPLVMKAGFRYNDRGSNYWQNLYTLTETELYELYVVCRNSFNHTKLNKTINLMDFPIKIYCKEDDKHFRTTKGKSYPAKRIKDKYLEDHFEMVNDQGWIVKLYKPGMFHGFRIEKF